MESQAIHSAANNMSILHLFGQAEFIVKLVMLLLLAASIYSWTIIFDKWIKFRFLKRDIAQFEKKFWSGMLLSKLYETIKNKIDNPLAAIFVTAMQEWEHANNKNLLRSDSLQVNFKQRIAQSMQLIANREIEKYQSNLAFLAVIGSSATFIGLFGTVWGIMSSFQAIAVNQNTSLAIVAPGIAEALLATAIGLFAAIPAMIFYNIFSNKLNNLVAIIDNFSGELHALISRQLDKEDK